MNPEGAEGGEFAAQECQSGCLETTGSALARERNEAVAIASLTYPITSFGALLAGLGLTGCHPRACYHAGRERT